MALALERDVSEQEFNRYVNRLLLWDEWMERYPDDVYLLSDTCEVLSVESFFPVYDVFSELMKKYKVNYVQAADLNKIINKLVGNAQKLDGKQVKRVEHECSFTKVKCDVKRQPGCSDQMWRAFERTLQSVYCQCKAGVDKEEAFVLFGKNLDGHVTIKVTFETIEEGAEDFVKHTDSVRVMCCSSLKEFFSMPQTPVRVLQNHRHKEDLSLAVRVAVYQKGQLRRVMDVFSEYRFYIQDSFYKDYRLAHYDSQPNFLTSLTHAMSNCLLNLQLRDREDFRTGKGGNNKQLRNGDYWAWRWYITQSVKMQYWQRKNDYRFANLKEHDIFECEWEGR